MEDLLELYQNLSWEELELFGLSGDPDHDEQKLAELPREALW